MKQYSEAVLRGVSLFNYVYMTLSRIKNKGVDRIDNWTGRAINRSMLSLSTLQPTFTNSKCWH
jgi:hypothetical protein